MTYVIRSQSTSLSKTRKGKRFQLPHPGTSDHGLGTAPTLQLTLLPGRDSVRNQTLLSPQFT